MDVNDDDEEDVGRILCASDEAATEFGKDNMSCWAGDFVLFSDECEFSICSFNA